MARVKLSPILTQASGSIGGITLQRNKYGMTMRQKPLPINPSSSAQYVVRQHMVTVQAAWQALTDAQRLQWDRFPDFSGQSIKRDRFVKISGHALYIKYQIMRLLTGQALLTTIAYTPFPTLTTFEKFEANYPLMWIEFNVGVSSTEYWFLLRMSSPRLPSKKFSPRGLRVINANYGSSDLYNIGANYIAAFGAAANIGDTVHYTLQFFGYTSPVISGIISGVAVIQVVT